MLRLRTSKFSILLSGTRSKTPFNITRPGISCFSAQPEARCYSQSSGKNDGPKEHSVRRAKKGDTRDPAAAAAASGIEERELNEYIADDSKSGATTERGGSKHAAKAKREHPAAPEPIIGMNDERARKGN